MQNIIDGWPMIKANPVTFFLILLVIIGAVWAMIEWSYRGVLASKNGQIELQDRQLADYKEKLRGATPDQAKAQIEALEARLSRLEPRRLSANQKTALRSSLSQLTNLSLRVQSEGTCPDCLVYATDFTQFFISTLGWKVESVTYIGPSTRSRVGLALRVENTSKLSPEAEQLVKAFRNADIQLEILSGGAQLVLDISAKL